MIRVFIGANAISGITRRALTDEDCPRRSDNFRDRLSEVGMAWNAERGGQGSPGSYRESPGWFTIADGEPLN